MRDPSPEAAGGAERLRAAGIDVRSDGDPTPFAQQNEGWLKRVRTGMPLVRVKLGLSLDGRSSFSVGERAAITGASGREVTARLRAGADAVLVSAATVDADDPALTVRDTDGGLAERQPLRVVLVRKRTARPTAQVFTDGAAPTMLLAPEELAAGRGGGVPPSAVFQSYAAAEGLSGALRALGARGVSEVLIEPGPRLFSALWRERLIDELVTVVAGGMAGAEAPAMFAGEPSRDGDVLRHIVVPQEAGIVGDVAVTVWRPARDEKS
jgi:diaminohydroxyphosphoribosylaminopyrimidine deaminase/5-amino-6-(5-phosphoribosylamino)uracil reductase